jgi:hypothetical protein
MAQRYLRWLSQCFPNERIGLIWDSASAHLMDEVVGYAQELGFAMSFIAAGLTSVLQVCDLVANKPLKQRFRQLYNQFKIRNDPGPGGKYKVERDDVLVWLEQGISEFNAANKNKRTIEHAFRRYGQDFRVNPDEPNSEFANHITNLCENSIYGSLIENQTALSLDD